MKKAMNLRRLIFSCAYLAGMIGGVTASAFSVRTLTRSEIGIADSLEVENQRYTRYVQHSQERWMKMIPNLGTVQYAGNIGMVSLGIGWDYGKHEAWETHVLVGCLPKYNTENFSLTFTLKENYIPWHVGVTDKAVFHPACFTVFLNSIFGDEFWTEEPDRYPSGYYGFSSRVRINLGVGQRLDFNIPVHKRVHAEKVSLYYELSVCDLHLISAVPNKNITLADILRLGIGLQYRFF